MKLKIKNQNLHFVLFIWLCNLILKVESSSKMLKIGFSILHKYYIYTYFSNYYGFSNYYEINLQNEFSYTEKYNEDKLNILSSDNITINSQIYKRNLLYEKIKVEPISLFMNWYHISKCEEISLSGMTFALSPRNESFSFLHQLKKYGKIEKIIFGFNKRKRESGDLYIGEIPSQVFYKKYHGGCRANFDFWGCKLNKVYFSNQDRIKKKLEYKVSKDVKFQTAIQEILVSNEFFELIKEQRLKELYQKKICYDKVLTNYERKTIYCQSKSQLPNLFPGYFFLHIGDYEYSINVSKLITLHKDKTFKNYYKLNFATSTNPNENDDWIIGTVFIKQFESIFNGEEKRIDFYTDIPNITKISNKQPIIFFIFCDICFIFIGLTINIYLSFQRK